MPIRGVPYHKTGNCSSLATENGVIVFTLAPSIGIPRLIFSVMRIPWFCFGCDRIRFEFFPFIEVIIQGHGHRVALTDLVVAHRGHAVFVDKAVTAEHSADQLGRMVPPVAEIGAGNVSPVVAPLVLKDIEQVVAPVPEDRAVGVKRHAGSLGNHKVIAGPVRIGKQSLSQCSGGSRFLLGGEFDRDRRWPLGRRGLCMHGCEHQDESTKYFPSKSAAHQMYLNGGRSVN